MTFVNENDTILLLGLIHFLFDLVVSRFSIEKRFSRPLRNVPSVFSNNFHKLLFQSHENTKKYDKFYFSIQNVDSTLSHHHVTAQNKSIGKM